MNEKISIIDARMKHEIPNRFGIDLHLLSDQQITALSGPSGSGKSTLLKLITGLIPSESVVKLNGIRLDRDERGQSRPLHRRRIGMVFQDDLLFPHFNVRENIEFGRRFAVDHDRLDDRAMSRLIEDFGIGRLLGQSIATLSGGERQRVGLVRALAGSPQLLICDEPVSAIDRTGRNQVLGQIVNWVESNNMAMILVTHDHQEIKDFTGHVWQLDHGRLVN